MRLTKRRVRHLLANALVGALACIALAAPGIAAATEAPTINLPVTVRGYYYSPSAGTYLHFLDGTVTNDTSVTVSVECAEVNWIESAGVVTKQWIGVTLAPGEWTTFHTDWPSEVGVAWTPGVAVGVARKCEGGVKPLALRLEGVGPVNVEDGMRWYYAKITNTASVPVSGIRLIGREMSGTDFVDTLFSWDIPDSLAPGADAYVRVRGKAPAIGTPVPEMRFTALEQPTITLTPNTLAPVYGTPITFRIDLKRSNGSPATGWRTLKIYHSYDGENWEWDGYFHQETDTGSVTTQLTPDRPTYYRAVYWGGDDLSEVQGPWMLATPRLAVGAPSTPGSVRAKKLFSVSGLIGAGVKSSGKPVTIYAEKKIGRRWVRKLKVTTAANANGAYKRTLKLTSRGTWRIRAYRSGVGYSKYRTVRVK